MEGERVLSENRGDMHAGIKLALNNIDVTVIQLFRAKYGTHVLLQLFKASATVVTVFAPSPS